jgi:hypothetical protein
LLLASWWLHDHCTGRRPLTWWLPVLMLFWSFVVGLTVIFRFHHYRLWELALLAGLAGLANLAYRGLQDWVLLMLALGVPHLVALFCQAVRSDRRRWWVAVLLRMDRALRVTLRGALFRFQMAWPAAAFAVLVVLSLIPPLARAMPVQDSGEWPLAAVDHIEKNGLHGRFFGPTDYGSYVTWRLGDRAQCYVDTRGFFFPPLLIEDSHYLPQLAAGWQLRLQRVLDQYHTDYFLLESTGPRSHLWRSLQPHVSQPLYCDEQTVLLGADQVRRGVANLRGDRVPANQK